MRSKLSFALLLLAVLPLFSSSRTHAQEAPTVGLSYTVTDGVTYTTGQNGPLKADVYIPTGPGPFPGIVFIHGGAWNHGDRTQMVTVIKALAEAGYVGFTIDYDLGKSTFPASFHQSLAAVKFLRDHSAEYRVDPHRIAVAGSSAGGELAALVALDPDGKPLNAPHSGHASPVQAAIIFNGAFDLTHPDADPSKPGDVTVYLGGQCAAVQEACNAASPVTQVHSGAPPFYVGHGTADQEVPFAQAVAFTDALQKANVPLKFFQAQNGKHTYWADPRFFADNVEQVKAFLAAHLGAPAGSR